MKSNNYFSEFKKQQTMSYKGKKSFALNLSNEKIDNIINDTDNNEENQIPFELNKNVNQSHTSIELYQVKMDHDRIKTKANYMENELRNVNTEFKLLEKQEQFSIVEMTNLEHKKNIIDQALKETTDMINQQQIDKKNYLYMISRIEKDILALKAKSNSLQSSFEYKSKIESSEEVMKRKVREEALQAKRGLKQLTTKFKSVQKQRSKNINELTFIVEENELAANEKSQILERRLKISESSINDNSDKNEKNYRNILLINRLYGQILRMKMKNEMEKSINLDKAVRDLNNNTRIRDIQEILKTFLTKENVYFLNQINLTTNEKKLKDLQKENVNLKNIINDKFKILGNKQKPNSLEEEMKEYVNLKKDAENNAITNNKCKKVENEIKEWIKKMKNNLENQLTKLDEKLILEKLSSIEISEADKSFSILSHIVKDLSEKFLDKKNKSISLKPFMKNFLTDSFNQKIIRVSPDFTKLSIDFNNQKTMKSELNKIGPKENSFNESINKELSYDLFEIRSKLKKSSFENTLKNMKLKNQNIIKSDEKTNKILEIKESIK